MARSFDLGDGAHSGAGQGDGDGIGRIAKNVSKKEGARDGKTDHSTNHGPKNRKAKPTKPNVCTRYYAVRKGKAVGIYTDAAEFTKQLEGYSGSEGKSFKTRAEAETWLCDTAHGARRHGGAPSSGLELEPREARRPAKGATQPLRPHPRPPHRGISMEEIIARTLPKQSPKCSPVGTAEWFEAIHCLQGSDGVYRVWGNMVQNMVLMNRTLHLPQFWTCLESSLLNLALSTLPVPASDLLIEEAKNELAGFMQGFNPPLNRRGGFTKDIASAIWSLTLKAFGSYASKLHGRGSDVDLQIDGTFYVPSKKKRMHASQMHRRDAVKFIHVFGARLMSMPGKYKVQKIPNARTPILKVLDLRRRVSCDIAFPCDGAVDWPKSELLLVLNRMDDRLRSVLALVKAWASAYQLRDAAFGRFNTYTLTSLIVFYFQTIQKPILPPLNELVSPQLISAAKRYEDLSGHVADMAQRARLWLVSRPESSRNKESVMELFLGFLTWLEDTIVEIVGDGSGMDDLRPLKLMTYTATSSTFRDSDRTRRAKLLFVADPFDSEDNSARALTMTCLAHTGHCAAATLSMCGEMDVDEWMSRVFEVEKKAPR